MSFFEIQKKLTTTVSSKQHKNKQVSKQELEANNKSANLIMKHKGLTNGIIFGVGAGLGDGFATVYSTKNNIKKSLAEYKGYSFSQKKEALKEILNIKGMSLKKYKDFIQKEMNVSMPKVMLRRALLYGTVLGLIGFGVDAYSNKKDKVTKTN